MVWKVVVVTAGASYQTLVRPPAAADTGRVRLATLPLLLVLLAVSAAGCGSGSGKLDGEVKAAVIAQNQGRQVVSAVSCNDQAPPPRTLPDGGSVHAEHTCKVTFSDGRPAQVWAVHVLHLVVKDQPQLLYRIDRNGDGSGGASAVDLTKSFSAQMAVLKGALISHVRCVAGSPPAPAGATALQAADHVCSARVAGQGRQRWAVHTAPGGAMLLFQLG